MKRVVRFLGLGVLALVGAASGLGGYAYLAYPVMAEVSREPVEVTPEKRARGAYLAEHVASCVDCHSTRDFSRFSGPVVPGTFGRGGERFGHDMGLPGELVAGNITPYKLGNWSDGEIMRALTSGVTPEGRALFPLMNYPGFAQLCREDLESLVVYLRGLQPIEHTPASTELDFPVSLIVRTLPKAATIRDKCPDASDSRARGEYLVTIAGCTDCHTPREGSELKQELAFSGGVPFPLPNAPIVRSKNITPDVESGIGGWTREQFIARFATYRDPSNVHAVEPGAPNTVMPWSMYAGMTDEDLGAIYDYLRTLKPVNTSGTKLAAN